MLPYLAQSSDLLYACYRAHSIHHAAMRVLGFSSGRLSQCGDLTPPLLERMQRLVPTPDGSDDLAGALGPAGGARVCVDLLDEAVSSVTGLPRSGVGKATATGARMAAGSSCSRPTVAPSLSTTSAVIPPAAPA
jgi:hypothetical protein